MAKLVNSFSFKLLLIFLSVAESFNSTPHSSLCRLHISMALRINSSDGLVLSAACGQRGDAVMSLGASDGHLLLDMYGGKKKISLRSRKKYNDDQWHTVSSGSHDVLSKSMTLLYFHN